MNLCPSNGERELLFFDKKGLIIGKYLLNKFEKLKKFTSNVLYLFLRYSVKLIPK